MQTLDGSQQASHAAAWLGGNIDDALSNIHVPAFILNRDGVIRWQNARATTIIGETRGRHFSSVVAPDAVHQARIEFAKQIVGTARTADHRLVMRSVDGARSTVEVHTVALDDGGRVVGVFGILEVETEYAAPAPVRDALTPRQQEVLAELARGASTQ
jgi:PAS domain-containing protein